MAKKKVNKTQLIKDALAKNPKASPIEIAEGLKKHGISAQYVSTVKSSLKAKKPTKTAKKKVAKRKVAKKSDKVSLGDLVKASKLAEELGGVDKAQEMLNALAKLK
jgi:DNA-binding IscR family transcriptional regulator